jgi:hypothetical protein
MPLMLSLRSFRCATTHGHVINFVAKEPVMVPDAVVSEAMAAGAVPANDADVPFIENAARARVEFIGDVRKSMLYLAVKTICEENDTKNFDGGGSPKQSAVGDLLGLTIGKAELRDVFQQYLSIKSSGQDFPLHPNATNILRVIEAGSKEELLELADEFGESKSKLGGMQIKDLRRALLVKLNGLAVG